MILNRWSRGIATIGLLLALLPEAQADDFNFITIDVPGSTYTSVNGINDSGIIVGWFLNDNGRAQAFSDSFGNITAIDVPNLAGEDSIRRTIGSFANDINNAGTIVGTFYNRADAGEFNYGFIEKKGQFSMPNSCCPVVNPNGINNQGDIVGNLFKGGASSDAFLQDAKGNRTTLSVPGAYQTFAYDINDRGDIVGNYRDQSGYHSYLYKKGFFTTLNFPGATFAEALGINNKGDIVGSYVDFDEKTHGFLDINGRFLTVDVPGSVWTTVTGINNSGLFVGSFLDSSGHVHGFVDPPAEVPEPSTWLLLASGVIVLMMSKIRALNLQRAVLTVLAWMILGTVATYAADQQATQDAEMFGAKLNGQSLLGQQHKDAYGPGIHSDSTGRPFSWQGEAQPNPLLQVKPNAYGLGVGSDQFGRPVKPVCPPGMKWC